MSEGRRRRVLCVDDHPDVAHTLATVFNLYGFEAQECLDAATALEIAPEFRPDACVLDINMPGMDGCELAERLRSLLGPSVTLVALSAAQGEEHDRRVAEAGFDRSLTKPPLLARLVEAVTNGAE